MVCGDSVKMYEDFPTLVTKKLAFASQFLFCHGIIYQIQHDSSPPPTLLFSVSRLKINLKCRHFDTTEVIEEELQAVLNTLTERDFQDAFKKLQNHCERCISAEGDYFEGDGGQYAQS
jgi:hypothetical protein